MHCIVHPKDGRSDGKSCSWVLLGPLCPHVVDDLLYYLVFRFFYVRQRPSHFVFISRYSSFSTTSIDLVTECDVASFFGSDRPFGLCVFWTAVVSPPVFGLYSDLLPRSAVEA